jgi:hypothetical protein
MKKLWNEYWPIFMGLLLGVVIVGAQVLFAADLTRVNELDFGPSGDTPKAAFQKLDDEFDVQLGYINNIRSNYASGTQPTNPEAGQMWYDTGNSLMKLWESSWSSLYNSTGTWVGDINNSVITASTINADYATITDMDVVTATITSLTTSNWTQDTATFNTMNSNAAAITILTVNLYSESLVFGVQEFADGDTTPDVSGGVIFNDNNFSASATIVSLDNSSTGQVVILYSISGTPMRINDGGVFALVGNWTPSSDSSIILVKNAAGLWLEVSRSAP